MVREQAEQSPASLRALDLANGNKGIGRFGKQGRQVVIVAEDRIAEHGFGSLRGWLDDADDLVLCLGFDHIDAGAAVAAAAEQQ